MNLNSISSIVEKLGTLEPEDRCVWEGDQLVISKDSLWDTIGKTIRRLPCFPQEPQERFVLSQRTLNTIFTFLVTHERALHVHNMEDFRKLKLYLANDEWKCPLALQSIAKINDLLKRHHRLGNLPTDLLQRIAGFDPTATLYRALRQVSLSCYSALHPQSLTIGAFFTRALQGSRRHIAELVQFLVLLEKNKTEGRDDLLYKFLNSATPQVLALFRKYVLDNGHDEAMARIKQLDPKKLQTLFLKCDLFTLRLLPSPEKIGHMILNESQDPPNRPVADKVAKLTQLKIVEINDKTLSAQQMAHFKTLPKLEQLHVTFPLQAETIRSLATLQPLDTLAICVNQPATKEICTLQNARKLFVSSIRPKQQLAQFFHDFFQLTPTFTLPVKEAIEILQRCPNLAGIEIGVAPLTNEEIEALQQALLQAKSLEQLALQVNDAGSLSALWPTLLQLPKLRTLAIYTQAAFPALSQEAMISSPLESLTISSANFTHAAKVVPKLRQLRRLAIQGIFRTTDIEQMALCKKLQSIHFFPRSLFGLLIANFVNGYSELQATHMKMLAGIETLQEIHFATSNSVTAEEALAILRAHPQLQALSGFTQAQLQSIPAELRMTKVERFVLSKESS